MQNWGFGMGLGWIIPLLFIFALFYFFNNTNNSKDSARDILDKRFANGEIDEEEYERRKERLS
ncbi:SHOCT domain-containing protein [Sulfurimonas sp. SAG-AH-194-L11]|nr:SHOCT domain-containing protein [Sulfurimonas sp. SAG-AH-194-L11]MDF1877097.1 SHOCT domain-containing protein [Sulfurimonas sp. SAG-AH-194-L11]